MKEAPRQRMERQTGKLSDALIQAFEERFAQSGAGRNGRAVSADFSFLLGKAQ